MTEGLWMLDADKFKYLIFAVAGVVIVVGSIAVVQSQRARIRQRLGNRLAISDSEFQSFFPSAADADIALAVRNKLKGYLLIPVELVHPDDKLCADLGLAAEDGLDANFFVLDVERATGTKIPDTDAEKMYTLRDTVSYISARKMQ